MKQVNMVQCIRCNEEWALEDSDGVCDECMPKVEIEMAAMDLWVAITTLKSRDPKYLSEVKNTLTTAAKTLAALVETI